MKQTRIKKALETLLQRLREDEDLDYMCFAFDSNSEWPKGIKNYLKDCFSKVPGNKYGIDLSLYKTHVVKKPVYWNNNTFRVVLLQDLIEGMKKGKVFNQYTIAKTIYKYNNNITALLQRMRKVRG